jgi:soluble cytochrome b562
MSEEFVVRVDPALDQIYALTNFVLEHMLVMGEKEFVTPRDVAWVRRHLALLDHYVVEIRNVREFDSEHILQKSDLKALIKEAHDIGEDLVTKMREDATVDDAEFPVFKSWFPEGLDPKLRAAYNELIDIVIALDTVKNKPFIRHQDIGKIQLKLGEVEDKMKVGPTHGLTEAGEASLMEMFEEIHAMVYDFVQQLPDNLYPEPEVDPEMKPLKEKLEHVIDQLKELKSKPTSWVNTKDIGRIQCRLQDIDEKYKQAGFAKDTKLLHGQAILAELLATAHSLASEIVDNLPSTPTENIDPSLKSLSRKLGSIGEQLKELKRRPTGQVTAKELGHLQNKLHEIDEMYKDSKFPVHGEIPVGQAVLSEKLAECHELVRSIQESNLDMTGESVGEDLKNLNSRLDLIIGKLYRLRVRPAEQISTKDVGKIQNDLSRIDDVYRDAKFVVSSGRGHAVLSEKLNYAHELAHDIVTKIPEQEMF